MYFVYVLRSRVDCKFYVGQTACVEKRLDEHNAGFVDATRDRRPLELATYVAVQSREKAYELERYFKSGSGRAFLKSHFM